MAFFHCYCCLCDCSSDRGAIITFGVFMAPRNGSGKSSYPLAHEAPLNSEETPPGFLAAYQMDSFDPVLAAIPDTADRMEVTKDRLAVVFFHGASGDERGAPIERRYRGHLVVLLPPYTFTDPIDWKSGVQERGRIEAIGYGEECVLPIPEWAKSFRFENGMAMISGNGDGDYRFNGEPFIRIGSYRDEGTEHITITPMG
jgi:hypothetical protein